MWPKLFQRLKIINLYTAVSERSEEILTRWARFVVRILHTDNPGITVRAAIQLTIQNNTATHTVTDMGKEEIEAAVLAHEKTQEQLQGRTPKKVIVVPGKIVNIVG